MATVFQVIELYRRILDYLMPLEMGILGWGENVFPRNGGGFDSAGSRSDDINGRFFYTGLGSGLPGGGYVHVESEKIRGDVFTRNTGGVLGIGGLRGVDSIRSVDGTRGVGGFRGVNIARGFGGASAVDDFGSMRDVGSLFGGGAVSNVDGVSGVGGVSDLMGLMGAWNVGNDSIWGMSSTSKALTDVSAINAAGKKNALEYRLGEGLEKQLNGRQILGADGLASIDRSLEITGRGFSVMGRISELLGEQNAFSQNKRLSELRRKQNAVSAKWAAANTSGSFEENADMPTAKRGLAGQESGETARLGSSGGCDADTLVDMLCGAFREAAFSMSEGVHY